MNAEYDKGYQSGYDAGYKRAMLDYGLEDDKPCEDAVSRQAVFNQIFYSTDNSGDVELGSVLRRRIENLPPVTPKQRWIPVSEGLPEIEEDCDFSDDVQVTIETRCNPMGDLYRYVVQADWDGEKWCDAYGNNYFNDAEDDTKVTAWMPLPEPYEEGADE